MKMQERFIAIPNVFWKGEADVDKNLRASKFIIFWACIALLSLMLSGCGGGGDGGPDFFDDADRIGRGIGVGDDAEREDLELSVPTASLVGTSGSIPRDASTTYSVRLIADESQRAPQRDVTVNLAVSGTVDSFTFPRQVVIRAGTGAQDFVISAASDAQLGDAIQVGLAAGSGYEVGDVGVLTLTVAELAVSAFGDSVEQSMDPWVRVLAGLADGADVALAPGDPTRFAIQLNRSLEKDLVVALATVDPTGVLQGAPESVTIPAGELLGLVTVAVAEEAVPGSEAEITLIPSPDYGVVSEASVFKVMASTVPVATLTFSGGDYSPVPGEVVLYNLDRSSSTGGVSLPLLVTGDRDSFEVPAQLSFNDGSTSVTFAVKVSGAEGVAEIFFLPPQGYGLGAEPSVRLETRPN